MSKQMELAGQIEAKVVELKAQATADDVPVVGKVVVKPGLFRSRTWFVSVTKSWLNEPCFYCPVHFNSKTWHKCVVKTGGRLWWVAFWHCGVFYGVLKLRPPFIGEAS